MNYSKPKRISVVTPNHNDGDTLELHIETFIDQDYPDKELIIIDDGSTDNSRAIIEKYVKRYPGLVRGIYFPKNKGACVARNWGAKEATGDVYSFLPADSFLNPGLLTAWMEMLEENPDCAFIYGGYYFVDNQIKKPSWMGGRIEIPYHSQPFDVRDLKTANYIDGSFPIRKEAFWGAAEKMGLRDGLWNNRVKSLQDWDFWLSVVLEYGGKGKFYGNLFFETTMPHRGGLSDDSHTNWLARTKQIQAIHKIPESPICVTSPYNFATFHGQSVAKILDADYKEYPPMKAHDYKAIYSIGFPIYGNLEDAKSIFTTSRFLGQVQALKASGTWDGNVPLSGAKRLIHFIGSDILSLHKLSMETLIKVKNFLNDCTGVFAELPATQKELKHFGIESDVVPFPPRKWYDVEPLPKKKAIAIYLPANNEAFYFRNVFLGYDEQKGLVDLMPDVDFHVFGNDLEKKPKKAKNYKIWGRTNGVGDIIKATNAIIRIVPHDGLSISVAEWIGAGRNALTTVKMPHAEHFDMAEFSKQVTGEQTIAVLMSQLRERIYEVLKMPLNTAGSKYYRKWLDEKTYKKKIYSYLEYNPKRYWEKRAKSWNMEARIYEVQTKKIQNILSEIPYKSVVDVGSGNGRFVPYFEGKEYIGFDISKSLVEISKANYPKHKFFVSTVEDAKLDKKYDLAFVYTVLQHVKPEDIQRAVDSLKKMAKQILLVEPVNFIPTGDYCYNHDYDKLFNVTKKWKLHDQTAHLIKT